jgi:hypothetical protein
VPTKRAIDASKARYAGTYVGSDGKRRTLKDLVVDRQAYELMLAMRRKKRASTEFYRLTQEPVKGRGLCYFIWPLPPGCVVPGPGIQDLAWAQEMLTHHNATANPYKTGEWWMPTRKRYTAANLQEWLPPATVFTSTYDPTKKRAARSSRKRRSA